MLSVVIPTKDSEEALARTLAALVPAAAEGIVREVVVADGGSCDQTELVAEGTGCLFVAEAGAIDRRLADGAAASSRGEWLMFLPPGVLLDVGWERDFIAFAERAARRGDRRLAAVFRFAVDGTGPDAALRRLAVRLVRLITGIPHPDQGLIIARSFYRELGGFRERGAFCAADLCRRIGRGRLASLRAGACRVAGDRQCEALLAGGGLRALLTFRLPLPLLRRGMR